MLILAIDPGDTKSAWVRYDLRTDKLKSFAIMDNDALLQRLLHEVSTPNVAIEMIASYGMPVGKTVFETCVWIGRFTQAYLGGNAGGHRHVDYVYRKDVKMHLCNSTRAKDGNVRQALMDRYGSTRQRAIGTKKSPGPLYGVSKDVWSALGVAVTWAETKWDAR